MVVNDHPQNIDGAWEIRTLSHVFGDDHGVNNAVAITQGISPGFIPGTLDTKSYDEIIRVTSDDAIATGRVIGGQEGFLLGISGGAAVYAAKQVAKKLGKGKKVLAVAPDNGERYLSTFLYDFGE